MEQCGKADEFRGAPWVPSLLRWFASHQRVLPWRSSPTPYRVLVSEFMLQQTQVATVLPYFERFLRVFPDLASLAAADSDAVLKQWEGLGYYSRARRLQECARIIMAQGGAVPDDFDALAALPGIGAYTAAAIASIAFGRHYPVVDGNVLRVQARLRALPDDIGSAAVKKRLYESLLGTIRQVADPSGFNQAQMELGAMICLPRQPRCSECPLREWCRALVLGAATDYPRKRARQALPTAEVAVGLIFQRGRLLIMQRSAEQMLGGLWEFPGGKIEAGESPAEAVAREVREETGLCVRAGQALGVIRHDYSHFHLRMHVFVCEEAGGVRQSRLRCERPHVWVTREALADYAFPKANHKLFALPAFAALSWECPPSAKG